LSSPINNFDFTVDRSPSDDYQRNRLAVNAMVNSPASEAHGFASHLTHGWRLSGILQYYSRLPFNATTGTNTRHATAQRPCILSYTLTENGGLNPCTEAMGGAVIGRNAGAGFDFFGMNARLSRTFSITERVKLEGMAETSNALNHRNNMIPNGTWGTQADPSLPNSTFGQATAVGDPRNVQLAARFTF
jgi:hypothetical protein